jgi:hypothetical protein
MANSSAARVALLPVPTPYLQGSGNWMNKSRVRDR